MNQDRVEVTFRGGRSFKVNRAELAKNLTAANKAAKDAELRPGESIFRDDSPSFDVTATRKTALDDLFKKKLISKKADIESTQ